jgi:anti-anti-sigma factor
VAIDPGEDDDIRVHLSGDLDLATSPQLSDLLDDTSDGSMRGKRVVVDLSELTFVDSTGLRALWTLREDVLAAGATLVLASPSDIVMRVLRTTKLDKIFQIVDPTEPLN